MAHALDASPPARERLRTRERTSRRAAPALHRAIAPRESLVAACVARLKRAILSRELVAGERLPPERELAASLAVNRTTLRAALHELARAGLLTARQGSGHVVHDFSRRGGPDLVPVLVSLAETPEEVMTVAADLLLVRRQLALGLVERLGARARGEAELAPLRAALDAFAAALPTSPDVRELVALDLAVVRALAALTGSSVLALFVNPIEDVLAGMPALAQAMYARPQENILAYRALIDALAAGGDVSAFVGAALASRDASTLEAMRGTMSPGGAR